ncbi:MAG: hypothetical protein NXI10_05505 [bacterium]|nr:hypothetical protein [bacterium]
MEALLIINSLLVAICLYFIKDFHSDFKATAKTVRKLKEKFGEMTGKMSSGFKSVKDHMSGLEKRVEQIEEEK